MSSTQLKEFAQRYIDYSLEKDPDTIKEAPDSYGRWMSTHQLGQIVIIPKETLYRVLDNAIDALDTDPDNPLKKLPITKKQKVYQGYKNHVFFMSMKNYTKWGPKSDVAQNVTETLKHLKQQNLIPEGAIVGFVTNFEQIKTWKKGNLTNLPVKVLEEHLEEAGRREATSTVREVVMKQTDVGHGEFGRSATNITLGRASAKALGDIDVSKLKVGEMDKIEEFQYRVDRTLNSKITHEMSIDDQGNFAKGYATINSLQLREENRGEDRHVEADITAWARENAQKYIDDPTSIRMTLGIERILLSALTKLTRRSTKVQIIGEKPATKIHETSTAQASGKTTFKRKVKAMTMAEPFDLKAVSKLKSKSKRKRGPALNIGALIMLLNQDLGKTVQDNMRAPALQNRTGRFAGSVKVLNVVQNQKFPSFQYTYDRSRYGRVEGTEPWSDGGNRDPRKLIDKSIREIAAELAIGRFYTQRL